MRLIKVIQDGYDIVRVQEEVDRLIQMIEDVMKEKKLIVVRLIVTPHIPSYWNMVLVTIGDVHTQDDKSCVYTLSLL